MSKKELKLYNEDAEMALVGAMIADPYRVIPYARDALRLEEAAFYVPAHRLIVHELYSMLNDTSVRNINLLALVDRLETGGIADRCGGMNYLGDCMGTGNAMQSQSYADIVRQKWILREIVRITDEIRGDAQMAKRADNLLQHIPERFMGIVDEVINATSNSDVVAGIMEDYRKASEIEGYMPGMSSGWPILDEIVNGFETGMIIIAGRPGQGKTTIEDCIATHVAGMGHAIARVTIDMTRKVLLERANCRMSGVSMPKARRGHVKVGSAQWEQLEKNGKYIADLPMHILEGETDLNVIMTWIRMMKLKYNIQMFSVDYIQQIYTGIPGIDANDNVRISKVSSAFKSLCFKLDIPGLILSQLSRSNEKEGKYPILSNLRGSGSLEQDADVAILSYQHKEAEYSTKKVRAQIVDVVKNKNGSTGPLGFWFHAPYFLFESLPWGMMHEDDEITRPHDRDTNIAPPAKPEKSKEVDIDLPF